MMNCPMCGQAAHTRSSFQVSNETKERYNQCTNIECGHTFVTHETFVRSVPSSKNQRSTASSKRCAGTICLLINNWRRGFTAP
ncbi:ogr/Delta-like zinc finger family protein [Citrobacter portucalensis]|uniref:ogr/Delta-like zinc finger family protein n=1 Tax=Citrobacter portucalensis TaxID=1639133 RepID=UPI0039F4FE04